MEVIGKKATRKMSQGKVRMKYIPNLSQPLWYRKKTVMFNSSSTSLSFWLSRAYISKPNLHIIMGKANIWGKNTCVV